MVGICHCIFPQTTWQQDTILLVLINSLIYYFVGNGEPFNGITAFVDASNVYASHKVDSKILRNGGGGKFVGGLQIEPNQNLLPKIDKTFRAGDMRAGEMPGLLSMHTIWLREHNRIGKKRKLTKYMQGF